MVRLSLILALLMIVSALVCAPSGVKNHKGMGAQLAAAQAAASRPGDESLNCEALQKELMSHVNDPAVQSYLAKSRTQTKQDATKMQAAKPAVSVQMVLTTFSSHIPEIGWASVTPLQAQSSAQQHTQTHGPLKIMPQLLRGQRMLELAKGRECEWLQLSSRSTGHEAGH